VTIAGYKSWWGRHEANCVTVWLMLTK